MLKRRNLSGMQVFTTVWFGQFISLLGTAMTNFALMIWAYEQVGRATTLALLGFFSIMPYILFSPLAGALVDRVEWPSTLQHFSSRCLRWR